MASVLKFDWKVILPTIVEGSLGNTGGAQLRTEIHAGPIKRKRIVNDNDAINRRDQDRDNAADWDARLDPLLVIAHKAEQRDDQQGQQIAILDSC